MALQEKSLFGFTTNALLLKQRPLKPQTFCVGKRKGRFVVSKYDAVWLADAAAVVIITLVAAILVDDRAFWVGLCL